MKTFKLTGTVDRDHKLVVDLPEEVEEGPIEVIVLSPDRAAPFPGSLEEHVARLMLRPPSRSVADIDEQIRQERDSWE